MPTLDLSSHSVDICLRRGANAQATNRWRRPLYCANTLPIRGDLGFAVKYDIVNLVGTQVSIAANVQDDDRTADEEVDCRSM